MTPLKSRQYCSVCKQWLEMEVVPTGDGDDDDGVIWFRCPQCQGFLPKLGGGDPTGDEPAADGGSASASGAASEVADASVDDDAMPWDSPAEMMAARRRDAAAGPDDDGDDDGAELDPDLAADLGLDVLVAAGDTEADDLDDALVVDDDAPARTGGRAAAPAAASPAGEPLAEYAALLESLDPADAVPYRPWETYELHQCILHLAWDDCGVVVGKEELPGGRKAIKCYFADAGVVRLIEDAPQ